MSTASPSPKPDRAWLYVTVAFLAAWGVYLAFFGPTLLVEESPIDSRGPLQMADYSWHMMDLENQPVDLSKYKGKTVFLNIWATWCGPCISEMPSIAALAANPRLKDVTFLCVSTEDSAEPIKTFLQGKNWPMTMLRAETAPAVFHTEGIPATFVIGPDGVIASTSMGASNWDSPDVIDFLAKLSEPKVAGKAESKGE